MNNNFKNIIYGCCLLLVLISIVLLIGIAGGVETDQLIISNAIRKSIIWLVFWVIGAVGIIKTEKEEDKYGRL